MTSNNDFRQRSLRGRHDRCCNGMLIYCVSSVQYQNGLASITAETRSSPSPRRLPLDGHSHRCVLEDCPYVVMSPYRPALPQSSRDEGWLTPPSPPGTQPAPRGISSHVLLSRSHPACMSRILHGHRSTTCLPRIQTQRLCSFAHSAYAIIGRLQVICRAPPRSPACRTTEARASGQDCGWSSFLCALQLACTA